MENRVFELSKRTPRSEGDIVLVYDDTPRSKWKIGRIEELYKRNDGQKRSARVRTQGRDIIEHFINCTL